MSVTEAATADLTASDISAGYGGPPILDGVGVEVTRGQVSVVLGPNGAGKSTLAKAIVGLIPTLKGEVTLQGRSIAGLPPHRRVRQGLGYLPQLANVFDELTALENLHMGAFSFKGDIAERLERIFELFPDLTGDRRKKAGQLSGGQQRMLALARLLMTDPVVAILDEPTAGLSPIYGDRVWEQIVSVAKSGVGLLIVEQNAQVALEHADYAYFLADGRNVLSGPVPELAGSPEVEAILVG
jgi:branched-chain amino acid transport system ATP-binding protein